MTQTQKVNRWYNIKLRSQFLEDEADEIYSRYYAGDSDARSMFETWWQTFRDEQKNSNDTQTENVLEVTHPVPRRGKRKESGSDAVQMDAVEFNKASIFVSYLNLMESPTTLSKIGARILRKDVQSLTASERAAWANGETAKIMRAHGWRSNGSGSWSKPDLDKQATPHETPELDKGDDATSELPVVRLIRMIRQLEPSEGDMRKFVLLLHEDRRIAKGTVLHYEKMLLALIRSGAKHTSLPQARLKQFLEMLEANRKEKSKEDSANELPPAVSIDVSSVKAKTRPDALASLRDTFTQLLASMPKKEHAEIQATYGDGLCGQIVRAVAGPWRGVCGTVDDHENGTLMLFVYSRLPNAELISSDRSEINEDEDITPTPCARWVVSAEFRAEQSLTLEHSSMRMIEVAMADAEVIDCYHPDYDKIRWDMGCVTPFDGNVSRQVIEWMRNELKLTGSSFEEDFEVVKRSIASSNVPPDSPDITMHAISVAFGCNVRTVERAMAAGRFVGGAAPTVVGGLDRKRYRWHSSQWLAIGYALNREKIRDA